MNHWEQVTPLADLLWCSVVWCGVVWHPAAAFDAPQGAVIPFGMLDDALRAAGAYQEYLDLVEKSETASVQELEDTCGRLRTLIKSEPTASPLLVPSPLYRWPYPSVGPVLGLPCVVRSAVSSKLWRRTGSGADAAPVCGVLCVGVYPWQASSCR